MPKNCVDCTCGGSSRLLLVQLVMEEQRFATVMWGGFDFIADAGGSDPAKREWLMECSGLQARFAAGAHSLCN